MNEGWSIRQLIEELNKLPEEDKDKPIFQNLDFYVGRINSISLNENGNYMLHEFSAPNEDNVKYINEFLDKAKEKYPNIIFEYKYEDGCYTVTHNYENELDDELWTEFFGNLLSNIIYQNEIYNFSFYWNCSLKSSS